MKHMMSLQQQSMDNFNTTQKSQLPNCPVQLLIPVGTLPLVLHISQVLSLLAVFVASGSQDEFEG